MRDGCAGMAVEPGFLSLDVDGRVLRVDTLSKCVAPGLRLGWISATDALLAPVLAALNTSTMGPSGPSTILAHKVTAAWGIDGFGAHLKALQQRYLSSAKLLCAALEAECGSLVEWKLPRGGMFLWIRVPGCGDVQRDLMDALVATKVCSHTCFPL